MKTGPVPDDQSPKHFMSTFTHKIATDSVRRWTPPSRYIRCTDKFLSFV
uniref:Uncharacterized protein n=1 Tax=Heterorhabditis bacteriophora TaxID=37862 RepID=A0A1I7XET8_HETBA